ncbi:MarR family transcriptional regulator [Anderseniella sp. Alg231-50]|uniref:MarR family transcriptional regulator n=1 Tax=Anderseniella sp. Alg231-50 TaxID=1922226 RepID=UPI000D55B524
MTQDDLNRVRDLIDRIARLSAADEWSDDINPTQWVALSYLARANRFSRAPSQVAEFMAATRGTVSQTLKALARKGLISEIRSAVDKRWISYSVTDDGMAVLSRKTIVDEAASNLDDAAVSRLADGLEALVRQALASRGKRAFGICASCRHHKKQGAGGYCMLLGEQLTKADGAKICHEHEEAA